ncbi:MAG: hypothetical protein JWO31_2201, partial [Phycisphaerales bacterium]|nr:hypothetical protein [Phycisphaerales bacterium]
WAVLAGAARPTAAAATPDQVEAALAKSRAFLYGKMQPNLYWEEADKADDKAGGASTKGKQWGGLSAMSVYALLASGERHLDPKLNPAVEWVKKQRIVGNYALGLRAQIWPFLPNVPETRQLAIKDRDAFLNGQHTTARLNKGAKRDRVGFYGYWYNDEKKAPGGGDFDLSVSQYGVLGMWACEQVDGVEVPIDYWAETDKAWKAAMFTEGEDNGGWAYNRTSAKPDFAKPRATMTAAGVATLFITQDYLLQYGNFGACRGGTPNPQIDAGLAWLDKNIKSLLGGNYYGMYGVERIGVASGKKYFGAVDWYDVGADYLVRTQGKDGSWGGSKDGTKPGSIPDTCFAMLFLSRGRAPVLMNKLEYALADPAARLPWAQRPRDVSNFARYVGRQTERDFNWQVVSLKAAADDLHDAPVLYISGSRPLEFSPDEVAKLKAFSDAGGLLLFSADCGDESFVKSVVGPDGLGRKLFPKYEFRDLPGNHPLFVDEVYAARNWKNKPRVLGVSNGVRELALVVPEADLGRAWQGRSEKTKEEAFQLGANIYYYAAEKGAIPPYRGDTRLVKLDPKVKPTVSVKVARVMVGGNPDPEPAGWPRLAAILNNAARVGVTTAPVTLGEGKLTPGPAGYAVAHLTGTGKFSLTKPQREEVKAYAAAGGVLVVDAAGGDGAFADAAERELAAIFGGDPAAVGPVVAPDEPVYQWPGFKIPAFEFRRYARAKATSKLNVPRVRAIEIAGKPRVFYSRDDLTHGLLGQPCDGIVGYDPATATAIMRNVVLYAAYNGRPPKPPAAAPPATKPATAPSGAAAKPPAAKPPAAKPPAAKASTKPAAK